MSDDTRRRLEHAELLNLHRNPTAKHTQQLATMSKSLQYVIKAIIQILCGLLQHHHLCKYKCNLSTICRKNKSIVTQLRPVIEEIHRLWAYFHELAAYRVYIRKSEWPSWFYKNIHFVDMHRVTQQLGASNRLKKKLETGEPVGLQKQSLGTNGTLTIAVKNLLGSIIATHT